MTSSEGLLLGPLVGGLSFDRANLWGRAAGPGRLHAWVGRKEDLSDARPAGTSLPLQAENGFAGVVPVEGLSPETTYYYALRLGPGAPVYPDGRFTTFPLPLQPVSFNFALGSCFRPGPGDNGRTFEDLAQRAQAEDLRFLLMTGDQIYADEWKHNGLGKVASTLDDYRSVYSHHFSQPPLRGLLRNLPAFMILDDHEVDDDWHWRDSQRQWADIPWWTKARRWLGGRPPQERHLPAQRVRYALQAYWEHQGMHAPAFRQPPRLDHSGLYTFLPDDPGSLAYAFYFGAAAFFVMDTRTMRVRSREERTLLGQAQWDLLQAWLLEVKEIYPVKFLVSSSAVLFRMSIDFAHDRWSGFPTEHNRLLGFIAEQGIRGVHILTGDLHAAHAVSAELYGPQAERIPVWEFCASPFAQSPNWLAHWTYTPLRSGPIARQKKHFVLSRPNYGVVRVDFSNPAGPQVRFEAWYEKKGEWRAKSTG
jgi:alkaline phosphatase D